MYKKKKKKKNQNFDFKNQNSELELKIGKNPSKSEWLAGMYSIVKLNQRSAMIVFVPYTHV